MHERRRHYFAHRRWIWPMARHLASLRQKAHHSRKLSIDNYKSMEAACHSLRFVWFQEKYVPKASSTSKTTCDLFTKNISYRMKEAVALSRAAKQRMSQTQVIGGGLVEGLHFINSKPSIMVFRMPGEIVSSLCIASEPPRFIPPDAPLYLHRSAIFHLKQRAPSLNDSRWRHGGSSAGQRRRHLYLFLIP